MPRLARALAPVLLLGTLLADGARGSPAADVVVQLRPQSGTTAALGAPWTFTARATNTTGSTLTATVVFELSSLTGGHPVNVRRWSVSLAPSETAKTSTTVTTGQWFVSAGAFRVTPLVDGVPAGSQLGFTVTAATVVVPRFRDVTASAGLDTTLAQPFCGQWAVGAAWGDVDGDGDLDLYVPNRSGVSQLWINDGQAHFAEEAAARGAQNSGGAGVGATFADYDNDGDQDLYVVNAGADRMYRNDGTGHFVDVTTQAGLGDSGVGPSSAWGDYDGDGNLDLYVVNHETCQGGYQPDRLYHNEGDGTFTDRTALLGDVGATLGAGYQAAWFDADHDGDQDLYLANDYLGIDPDRNHLWRNDGPGIGGTWTFTDVSAQSGTDWAINSMGIGIGDYDHDGDLDFAVSNIGPNLLARNNGDGSFTDVATQAGVARPFQNAETQSVTWGLDFADLNLDGWEDLYVAAGPIGGTVGQPNELYANPGGGRFLDLSAPSGADDRGVGRGVGFADFDRDGRVDLYVVNMSGSPRLLRNVTPMAGQHWLEVRAVGTVGSRDACGAWMTFTAGGTTWQREVFCGSTSFASSNDRVVHVGLGAAATVDSLRIEWPSGAVQTLSGVATNQLLEVTEPGAPGRAR